MQKGNILIFLLVGIVVLAAIGGAYYFGKSQVKPSISQPQVTTSPILAKVDVSPAPTGTGDNPIPNGMGETANWKTYTNTKYEYAINYPSNLIIFPEQYQNVENPETANGISIQQATDGYNKPLMKIYAFDSKSTKYKFTSLEELVKLNYEDNISNKNTIIKIIKQPTKFNFNDREAYEYKIESKGFFGAWTGFLGDQGIIRMIGFMHNNWYFLIGYYDNETFNQILSTFKFTQ